MAFWKSFLKVRFGKREHDQNHSKHLTDTKSSIWPNSTLSQTGVVALQHFDKDVHGYAIIFGSHQSRENLLK